MRAVGAVLLVLGAGGCNAIFGLDPTHSHVDGGPGGDADDDAPLAIDSPTGCAIGHDEDGDGIDDGCDLCPQIPGDPQVDSDGDGIGDACDPNPADNHDVLVFFDNFATPNPWQALRGTWELGKDALAQRDDTFASTVATRTIPSPDATDLTVDVVFTIDQLQPVQTGEIVAERGVGVWFVASGFSQAGDPSGYLCEIDEDVAPMVMPSSALTLSKYDESTATVMKLGVQPAAQHVAIAQPSRIRVQRGSPLLPDPERCHVEMPAISADALGNDVQFTTGTIGIRTVQAAATITSVTAYGRTP